MAVIGGQAIGGNPAEEVHAGDVTGLFSKSVPILSVAGNDEVGPPVVVEEWQHIFQPLDFLQASDEQEIGSVVRRRLHGLFRWSSGWKKVGEHLHLPRKSELPVLVTAEFTHGNEGIDVSQLPFELSRHTPQLRRPPVVQRATHALTPGA